MKDILLLLILVFILGAATAAVLPIAGIFPTPLNAASDTEEIVIRVREDGENHFHSGAPWDGAMDNPASGSH